MKNNIKNFNQKYLFNELLKLNKVIKPDLDSMAVRRKMYALAKSAKALLANESDIKQKLILLLDLIYVQWGFSSHSSNHFNSSCMLLEQVLKTKNGMPISLASIVLYLAADLKLPIYPISFPVQLLLKVELESEVLFIDPWDGKLNSKKDLHTLIQGYHGFGTKLQAKHLAVVTPEDVSERIEQILKGALMREGKNNAALNLIEFLLQSGANDPNDPYAIRDRGLILASLDCMHAALPDLDYFLEQCPDDPSAKVLQAQMEYMDIDSYQIH